jgi:hypothetical protein
MLASLNGQNFLGSVIRTVMWSLRILIMTVIYTFLSFLRLLAKNRITRDDPQFYNRTSLISLMEEKCFRRNVVALKYYVAY